MSWTPSPRRGHWVAAVVLAAAAFRGAAADPAQDVRVRSFELLNEGVAAYNRGEFALAVTKLRESASIALNSFRANYYLGLSLIGTRDYAEAVEVLQIALDLDPDHLQSLVAIGDAWLKRGDVGEARAAYSRALKVRPAYPAALAGLGRSYESVGETARAIDHYEQAIASNRGFAPAYTSLGDLYLRQGRLEEAVRLLEEAIEVRPDYAAGLNRLSIAYGQLGLHNAAVATIQEAITLEPGNAQHWAARGRLQLERGYVTAAEQSFARALELEAGMPEARAGFAWVAYTRGEYERALGELDAALADQRVDPLLARRLNEVRASIQQELDDVQAIDARLAESSATPADHARLAEIAIKRGSWAEAAEYQMNAGQSEADRERLAYLLFKAGRYRDAFGIYQELAETAPGTDVTLNLGVTLARLGDDAGASEAYRRVLADHPDHRMAAIYLGNALLRLGRREEAARYYQQSEASGVEDEASERVRRILQQIAPTSASPAAPAGMQGTATSADR